MNVPESGHSRRRRALLCLVSALLLGNLAQAEEQTLPILVTRTGTYTNVTVTTKKKDYVFILHAGGMGNIRVADLPDEALNAMGYATEPKKSSSGNPAVLAKEILPAVEAKLEPLQTTLQTALQEQLPNQKFAFGSPKTILGIAAGLLLALHLFFSYCCHLIVAKAKQAASVLTWIPVLQWIPLFRAAGMSGWWILLLFLPFTPIIWAFKIAKARQMSPLVAIFLILPVTSPFAFMYVAFKKEKASAEGAKYQSMSLQTA